MLKILILSVGIIGAYSAPSHNIVKKSGNIPARAGGEGPPYPLWHLEPLYVRKIPDKSEEKRSVSNDEDGVRSVSQVQESLMTSVNGDQQSMSQQLDQVSKNGEMMSKVFQQEKSDGKLGHKPHVEKMTQVDIPKLNIHQQFVDNNELDESEDSVRTVKRNAGIRMPSAEELAKYILTTGDENSVVELIEEMVDSQQMSEDQALLYVETVKAILDAAEREVEEEVIREALVERRLEEEAAMEEAERQLELRSLLQRGPKLARKRFQ